MNYRGKQVIVTGGLGFIGSNLAIRLVESGAIVTIVDSSVTGCGANRCNIASIASDVQVIERDIRETGFLSPVLAKAEIIFNLAGEISHVHSMQFPERDLAINTEAQLRFLHECSRVCPGVRIVYAGTRQIYGVPEYLPVDELHPIRPVDFNGVHKYAATMYHMMFWQSGHLDALVLRLTNVYGPRMSLESPCQGFFGAFLRQALTGGNIELYGDGSQLRDPVYVDDVVDAFLRAGVLAKPLERTFNIGTSDAVSLEQIASLLAALSPGLKVTMRPFPQDRKRIDIGSYYSDAALSREVLGWRPLMGLEEGLERTLLFYQENLPHYVKNPLEPASCPLHAVNKTTAG